MKHRLHHEFFLRYKLGKIDGIPSLSAHPIIKQTTIGHEEFDTLL